MSDHILDDITFILFVFSVISTFTYLVKTQVFFMMLKSNFNDMWRLLGSPSLFSNNTLSSNIKYLRFLMLKEYRSMDNLEVQKRASTLRYLLFLCFVLFPIVAILVIIQIALANAH